MVMSAFSPLFVAVVLVVTTSSTFLNNKYLPVTSSTTGRPLCSTAQPSSTVALPVAFSTECGFRCKIGACCVFYQYRFDVELCQLYTAVPAGGSMQPTNGSDCQAYVDASPVPICPQGFTAMCKGCYQVLAFHFTWPQATNSCMALSPPRSHLLVIQDSRKQDVMNYFLSTFAPWYSTCMIWWLGGRANNATGTRTAESFVWDAFPGTAAETVPMSYANWYGGTPSVSSGNCVLASAGLWINYGCDLPLGCALCEI